jgi:hypothetical protein
VLVILPTEDIVREYQQFDDLFVFYENGIKGVIADAILLNEMLTSDLHGIRGTKIVDKVLREYTNSIQAYNNYYRENTNVVTFIELIVENIMISVNEMFYCLFRNQTYFPSKVESRWHGNELIARILC